MKKVRSAIGKFGGLCVLAGVLLGAGPEAAAQNDMAMIILKDGRASEADIVSLGTAEVNFKLPGIASIQKMPYSQIEYIEFAQPQQWIDTMEAFDKGEYEKVAPAFKQVSSQLGASTGYPAPGNFATLAQRRLIDCYRRMRMPLEIGVVYRKLDWEKLPPVDRELKDIIECWALVGDTKYDEARAKIDATFEKVADTNPVSSELNFLLALLEEGSIPKKAPETEEEFKAVVQLEEEAIVNYGRSLGIDAGSDPGMAAAALRGVIENLIGKEDREEELKAMVHMYAGLHGNGKLWEGADQYMQQLYAAKLDLPVPSPKSGDGGGGAKEATARFVRIERVADEPTFVTLSEVQVMSGKVNIAGIGKAKQSSNGKVKKKEFPPKLAVDGKTAPGFLAGSFSRTDKEKNPWWELDLGAMKTIQEIVIYNCKSADGEFVKPPGTFRILLLDGSRKEVFKKEGEPSPEPKATIKVSGKAAPKVESEG